MSYINAYEKKTKNFGLCPFKNINGRKSTILMSMEFKCNPSKNLKRVSNKS
jgi:hypothetical protein